MNLLQRFALLTIPLALAACQAGATPQRDMGPAPAFTGIDKWIGSEPITIESQRGKVVLVDFWTYACINCINTLPYVKKWHETYKDKGLTVIGVHTPEYAFERKTSNVIDAAKRLGVTYPIAQDNRYATWQAYGNQYWPAVYLINKQGRIVYSHFGEGNYAETEAAIQRLLAE
jgi:thiol-disulfide isomerase/thioredoxin